MSVELLGDEDDRSPNNPVPPEGNQQVVRGHQEATSMTFAEAQDLYGAEVLDQIAALHISLR